MERYKYTLLVAIFLMGGSLVVAQEVLTLDKALKIAFENSPALVQSKLSLRQNELNLQAQKASLKSQFSLDVNPFSYSRSIGTTAITVNGMIVKACLLLLL